MVARAGWHHFAEGRRQNNFAQLLRRASSGRCSLSVLGVAWILIAVFAEPLAAETSLLRVEVTNAQGDLLPCRAWVEAQGQRLFEPRMPATCTPYARDTSFSCDGKFEIEVPAGRGVVHIERGKEFRVIERAFEAPENGTVELSLSLTRWIDMPSEGWYSTDMHVHFGVGQPRVLNQLARADDVHLTPVFTYWLRGTEPEWQTEWPTPSAGQNLHSGADRQPLVTSNNIEIERINRNAASGGSIGASFLFNLQRPVSVAHFGEHFPSDAALCLLAREHSPGVVIDTDKPSWSETVVGAALGVYDTVQVCHNHYHRRRTIPGGYGMIGPLTAGESNLVDDDGLFHRTNALYYRFLSCGFRLGVSGGSAIGVMAVPMGYNRLYAHLDGPLTAEGFWNAVKQGRTFATSGPMLELQADGQQMGATLTRTASDSEPLRLQARLRANETIDAVQLIHDGLVVREDRIGRGTALPFDREFSWTLQPIASGWVAARALYQAPDGRLRQAHTSPIYFLVDGQPIGRADDARYMLKWIHRLREVARQPGRFPSSSERDQVLAIYQEAAEVYQKIAAFGR